MIPGAQLLLLRACTGLTFQRAVLGLGVFMPAFVKVKYTEEFITAAPSTFQSAGTPG
jgi:hypothetical protein